SDIGLQSLLKYSTCSNMANKQANVTLINKCPFISRMHRCSRKAYRVLKELELRRRTYKIEIKQEHGLPQTELGPQHERPKHVCYKDGLISQLQALMDP
ncbi:hypothetical protein L9F63_028356, partial [Diploptera punctata]